ncbi:MAG: molybdopterin cofactor-binding domain-containing protein, partial [Burkholderiales bacterium]
MNAPVERIESFEDIAFQGISRRAFIVTAGGIGVAVAFGGTAGIGKALAQAVGFAPNAWIRVAADGIVTLQSPGSEMGQGTMTAMPLLIAEDMDLDWSKVRVEHAPHMPKLYGNPLFGGNMIVGASRTMRGYYEIMRLAGLQAREIMIQNAARHWKVPASELTTEPHHVVHRASGRKLSYGEIAAFAQVPAEMAAVTRDKLKPASQFR